MPPPAAHLSLTRPSPWITHHGPLIRPGGSVLDVACGGGRHARWLLARGHALTLVDRDTAYVADLTDQAEIITADLENGGVWPLAGRAFDAVVVTNYLYRPRLPDIITAVAPGGVLLYETFMRGHERFSRPRDPAHLLAPGELLEAVAGRLQVVAFAQGLRPAGAARKASVAQSLCAINGSDPVTLPDAPDAPDTIKAP